MGCGSPSRGGPSCGRSSRGGPRRGSPSRGDPSRRVGSGAARGAASGGAAIGDAALGGADSEGAGSGDAEPRGAEPEGAEPGGAELAGVEPGGAEPEGVEPGGAESEGAESGASLEWFAQRTCLQSGAAGAGDSAAGDTGAGGAGVTVGAGGTRGAAAAGPGGARTRGTGSAGTSGVGGAGVGDPKEPGAARAGGAGAGGTGAGGGGTGAGGAGPRGAGAVDPGAGGTVWPPTVSRLLATVVTYPSFESTTACALVADLVYFAAACRLEYATALVAESESASPLPVEGECALGTDVLEDRQEDFECLALAIPRFASMPLAPEGDPDAPDIPTPRSYAKAITTPYSFDGMWIFRVKRPPGSPPTFKARYVARGFSQRQGVDYFQTFSPTPKMTTLQVLLHVAAQSDYELHSLDFSTAFLQVSLHEEIWLRRPPGFTGSFPAGTPWNLRRQIYGLRQAPREWHDTLRTTLAALGFTPSTADPSLFLRTDTSLPPFYVLVYVDDLVFATADTEALTLVKLELQKRHTCTDLDELRSFLGLQIIRERARCTITLTQSHMVHQVLQRFGFCQNSEGTND
ncbi:unnamed protein product [Closterium sp. NIES-54]